MPYLELAKIAKILCFERLFEGYNEAKKSGLTFLNTGLIKILGFLMTQPFMRKINFQKDLLPHLVAIVVFIALTIFFFQPVFFDGMRLNQGDINQWAGSAQELIDYRQQTGEEGLWTNAIFGGMPAYFISVNWDSKLLLAANWAFGLGMPRPISFFTTGLLCAYIMLLCFRVRPYLAIVGAIAIAFSSYHIIGLTAGHNARVHTVVFMPLVIGAVHLCFGRLKWLGLGLTALALALQIRPNHVQITYYLALIVGLYLVARLIETIKTKDWQHLIRGSALVLAGTVLAIGTFWGKFYSAYEFSKYSNRGPSELTAQTEGTVDKKGMSKTYAFQYSNGISDPMTLFIPNYLGGPGPFADDSGMAEALRARGQDPNTVLRLQYQLPTYFGSESPVTYYAGAIMVFLFVLGCFIVQRKYVIWLVAVAALGVLLSYGRNLPAFNYFLFDYLPGYDKFRSVSFTMILPIIAIPMLAMLALEKLMTLKLMEIKKPVYISLGLTAGLSLVFGLLSGMFDVSTAAEVQLQLPDWLVGEIHDDRRALLRGDSFRSALFILLFAGALYVYQTEKLNKTLMMLVLMALPIADTLLVSSRFISNGNYQRGSRAQLFPTTQADQFILNNTRNGDRVFDLNRSLYDAMGAYHHHLINGYSAVRLKRYQEVIDNLLIPRETSSAVNNLRAGNRDMSLYPMMNMLNTRFLIYNPNSPQGVLTNPNAAGSAWLVSEADTVSTADGEFAQTRAMQDIKGKAVINTRRFDLSSTTFNAEGSINLEEYHPGYWKYQSNTTGNALAVFSEIYYPRHFTVTIDGQEASLLNANYILRALEIPAGTHTIEFQFRPSFFGFSKTLMFISTLLIMLLFFGGVYWELFKNPKPASE